MPTALDYAYSFVTRCTREHIKCQLRSCVWDPQVRCINTVVNLPMCARVCSEMKAGLAAAGAAAGALVFDLDGWDGLGDEEEEEAEEDEEDTDDSATEEAGVEGAWKGLLSDAVSTPAIAASL